MRVFRERLARHGRTIITAEVAVLVQLTGVGADALLRTALAIGGAVVTALVGIYESERRHGREILAAAAAAANATRARGDAVRLMADAARNLRDELANRMPLGGTTVPDGTPNERLVLMAEQLRAGRFTFLRGRRWSDWEGLAITLRRGRQEILAAVSLNGGRLPEDEEAHVRALAAVMANASLRAAAVASAYAGYDVTEEPKLPRYMPEDREIDVTSMSEYSQFAAEFQMIIRELDRMASPAA